MSTGVIHFVDQVRVPSDVFTLDGFRNWAHSAKFPESGRICFIKGNVEIDMSPEELFHHNSVKSDLYIDFGTLVRRLKLGRVFVDGAFLVNQEAELATEPDLIFCSYDSIRRHRVRFTAKGRRTTRLVEIRGAPDLVGEIVSDSSVRKDTVTLREAYFEAGIPEYWLIDARGRTVRFQILVPGKSGYVSVKADADGFLRSNVLGRQVRLIRETDEENCAAYRLLDR